MKKLTIVLSALLIIFVGKLYSQTWEEVPSSTSFILYGMSFPPNQNNVGYACGMQYTYDAPGVIIKTTDGGETWSTILPVSGEIDGLQAVCFLNDNVGFAGGWNNYFIKTTDGGASWTNITVGSNIWYFTDIEFWDSNNGVAIAQMDGSGQPVFITNDGGNTWTQATSGVDQVPFDITYASANILYLVGNTGTISKSTDGGYTWSNIYSTSGLLFSIDFQGSSFGVAGGEDGKMLATTNGGSSWSSYATGYENLWAAKAFTGDSAYIGGTDENIYKTTDGGQNWTMEYNGAGSSNLYKIVSTPNKTTFSCGSQGKMLSKQGPLNAAFTADQTMVCEGSSVNFIDQSSGANSWSWTFEGGTPATSTGQNPTVMYSAAGTYDVSLTVSDGQGSNSTLTKTNYIIVITAPGQANMPLGDNELCSGLTYEYATNQVAYASSYDWAVTPEEAGTFIGNGTTVDFKASNSWSGDFSIKVRAWNNCDYGAWSEELIGTTNMSPAEFDFMGGGEICDGAPGLEITLSGSELGVDYELFYNNESTGTIIAGTGNPLSFGLVNQQGTYSITGFTDYCSTVMIGDAWILINYIPEQLSMPSGTTEVCNDGENEYTTTNAQGTDVVIWTLFPENSGTIASDGMTATITWNNAFEGIASLSVMAENFCGAGPVSDALEILVSSTPTPEINGTELVCNNEVATYSTNENDGNLYGWEVIGGVISAGEGTSEITVAWGEASGQGYVIVNESLELGCSAIDSLAVTIDDCTGIEDFSQNNKLSIYPNPATDFISIKSQVKLISVSILNSEAKTLISKEVNGFEVKINTNELNAGIYFVQVVSEQAAVIKKLLIN
jgi:photosystem II stability/assembly factor-like uncharacterized protein